MHFMNIPYNKYILIKISTIQFSEGALISENITFSILILDCCFESVIGVDSYKGRYNFSTTLISESVKMHCKYNVNASLNRVCLANSISGAKWDETNLTGCLPKSETTLQLSKLYEVCIYYHQHHHRHRHVHRRGHRHSHHYHCRHRHRRCQASIFNLQSPIFNLLSPIFNLLRILMGNIRKVRVG